LEWWSWSWAWGGVLRCQAQLEAFYFLAGLVTVLRFGALCDRSLFTSTDARATDLTTGFLEVLLEWSRKVCYKLDWCTYCCWRCLTQQQQHQTEASAAAANAAAAARVCLEELKLSPPYLYSGHCSSSARKLWSMAGFI
jgi:hypothetical protein